MTLPKTNNTNTNQTTRLSVQVSLHGLSFLLLNDTGEPVAFHEIDFEYALAPEELHWELDKALKKYPELEASHTDVTVIHASNLYTVVPEPLFDESRASDYLKFNTKILRNDYVGFDDLEQLGLVVVYLPFMNANNFLFDRFGSFSYYHSSTQLLNHLVPKHKFEIKPKVFLHVQPGYFDCIVIRKGQLELCNSYAYKTPEDFIYFVLFCLEQLQLNPNEVATYVFGSIEKDTPLYVALYTYVRHVAFYEGFEPTINATSGHEAVLLKTTV